VFKPMLRPVTARGCREPCTSDVTGDSQEEHPLAPVTGADFRRCEYSCVNDETHGLEVVFDDFRRAAPVRRFGREQAADVLEHHD
jgi:hypothetical protein